MSTTTETVVLLKQKPEEKQTHPAPLSLPTWIEENKQYFLPPVGNKMINSVGCQFKVMIVGGPNTRTDYHINKGEEWFYQIKGDMILKVVDGGVFKDIVIKEGQCFLLPGGIPHSPQRYHNSHGLVLERERTANELDGLRWYCPNCRAVVFESFFRCEDLGTQLKVLIEKYYSDNKMRTCQKCGTVDSKPPRPLTIEEALALATQNNQAAAKLPTDAKAAAINPATHPFPRPFLPLVEQAEKDGKSTVICDSEFKVTIAIGPESPATNFQKKNAEVWFYQLKGDLSLSVQDSANSTSSLTLRPNDIYLLPTGRPFKTQRAAGSVGLVVDQSIPDPNAHL